MGLLRLFEDFDTKVFVAHEKSTDKYRLPDQFSGESPPVQFMGLQKNSSGSAGRDPWLKVDPASYALKVGVYRTSTSVLLAFQDVFDNDAVNFLKSGSLVQDSVAVAAALAAENNDVPVILETEVAPTSGGKWKAQITGRLKPGLITPIAVSVPAPEEAASKGWVRQTFVPRDGTQANLLCDGFFIKAIGGTNVYVQIDANKTWQISDS
jgi:hypothetical protein